MPTHEELRRFSRDFDKLSPETRKAFIEALEIFISDAGSGQFRPSLRVKRIRSARKRLWEMSFAADGRASFEMIPGGRREGLMHTVWWRVGDHSILDDG